MSAFSLQVEDGVAVITIDAPDARVNTLTRELGTVFGGMLDEIERRDDIRAAVLVSAKDDNFIAGADIHIFDELRTPDEVITLARQGQALFDRLAALAKPVVAAVHGSCLGGGLELILACHYRLASTDGSTRFAAPEVNLGLLPAFGGTQRLPRLVGLQTGLELLLSGRNVYAKPARRMGLVDALIHRQGLRDAAKRAAVGLADGTLKRRPARKKPADALLERPLLRRLPIDQLIYRRVAETVRKRTRGHYPAPPRIIEAVRIGMERGMPAGLEAEARFFAELVFTPESKALRHLFFAQTATRKNPYAEAARDVSEIRTIGVVGAGLMGSGIAQVSAERGFEVLLEDQSLELAARGKGRAYQGVSRRVGKGLSAFERDRIIEHITPVAGLDAFHAADLTVEAVVESLEVKQQVLQAVEAVTADDHIFATNTSSIPIGKIAAAAKRPQQVLGMHYFSPVPKMPLLEVVRGEATADWVLGTAIAVGLAQGKNIIVVADTPGFYTNRIMPMMMAEALQLLAEGADAAALDSAMRDFGFPVGPVTLIDEVGIDVGAKINVVLAELFAARGIPDDGTLQRLVEAGYLGRKSGRGFYRYQNGKKLKEIDTSIYRFFGGAQRKTIPAADIQERLSLAMVNEAVRCLEEGVIASPRDGDVGAVFGLGFPPFLGGPFFLIDQRGAATVRDALNRLAERHGERFRPAALLEQHARNGTRFYGGAGDGDRAGGEGRTETETE